MLRLLSTCICLAIGGALATPAYAQLFAIGTDGNLYLVNTANAATTLVGNTGIPAPGPGSLEFNPADGFLYSLLIGTSQLYRINPANAATIPIGPAGAFVFEGALQISPAGIMYGTNHGSAGTPSLFTVNLTTGLQTDVGVMPGAGGHDINGMAWRTSDNMLIGLDRVTNSLLVINPLTAGVAPLAAAPEMVGSLGGMTGSGVTGYLHPNSDMLYSVDLVTGATVPIGQMNIDSVGLAFIIPEPASLALLGMSLVFMRRRS